MSEDLEKAIDLIERLDLVLIRQRGQWVCGQLLNANGEPALEHLDLRIGVVGDVSGRLKHVGIASTIALAVAQSVVKLGNSISETKYTAPIMYFQASDFDPATKTWPRRENTSVDWQIMDEGLQAIANLSQP